MQSWNRNNFSFLREKEAMAVAANSCSNTFA
jgi:hypothetical protein